MFMGYISVILLSCSIPSGALENPGLLYDNISIAHTTILTMSRLSTSTGAGGAAAGGVAAAEPVLKSISDYNDTSADAGKSGAAEALKIMTTRKSSRKDDGSAKCQRKVRVMFRGKAIALFYCCHIPHLEVH